MKNSNRISLFLAVVLIAASGVASQAVFAAPKTVSAPARAKTPAPPQEQAITIEQLQTHVGDHIIVHTRFNTVRTGTLSKFNKMVLEMTLDSGVILTVPLDTVSSVAIPQASTKPDSAIPDSAKPEPTKPAIVKPGDGKPETVKPGTFKPDAAKAATPGDSSAKKN